MSPLSARLQCVLQDGLCQALDQVAGHKCDAPGYLQMAARETGIGAVESYMHAGKLLALELLVTVLQNKSQDWGNVRTEVRAQSCPAGYARLCCFRSLHQLVVHRICRAPSQMWLQCSHLGCALAPASLPALHFSDWSKTSCCSVLSRH